MILEKRTNISLRKGQSKSNGYCSLDTWHENHLKFFPRTVKGLNSIKISLGQLLIQECDIGFEHSTSSFDHWSSFYSGWVGKSITYPQQAELYLVFFVVWIFSSSSFTTRNHVHFNFQARFKYPFKIPVYTFNKIDKKSQY